MIHDINNKERKNRRSLYNDGIRKECSKCHEIKLHREFYSKNNGLRNICKDCNKIIVAEESFKNKFLILKNIYKGKFDGKCSRCDTNFINLPSIDFHHQKKKLKQKRWRDNRFQNWNELMLVLEQEKAVPLCKNCHSIEHADNFNDFKDIILNVDLFKNSAEEIHQIVYDFVKKCKNKHIKNFKFRVIEWIKKRFVIEQIYNGKCIGCGNVSVKYDLPALDFHHISKTTESDKLRWNRIKRYSITEIIDFLIEEKCVCLCSNCHTLLHATKFVVIADEILEKHYSDQAKVLYEEISENIKNFEFKRRIFKNPLELLFKQGEIWKKHILHIHNLNQIEGVDMIYSAKIKNILNISDRHLRRVLENLKKRKLIKIFRKDEKSYLRLTNIAHKKITKLLQDERYFQYLERIRKKNSNSPARNFDTR